ncbi:unnamed protein product [Amoebophrya sp. A25]|nr:unnamed protein product [Amoebophrya sp. A25]|eukprot:GSA25T00026484001.1
MILRTTPCMRVTRIEICRNTETTTRTSRSSVKPSIHIPKLSYNPQTNHLSCANGKDIMTQQKKILGELEG